jgi:UDP-glucose 4-epimerase
MLLKSNIQLSTGTGSSVLEVIKAFVSGQELPYKIVGRRGETLLRLMLIQIKQILFLDGKPSLLWKLWRGAWKWEQKVRKAE